MNKFEYTSKFVFDTSSKPENDTQILYEMSKMKKCFQ